MSDVIRQMIAEEAGRRGVDQALALGDGLPAAGTKQQGQRQGSRPAFE